MFVVFPSNPSRHCGCEGRLWPGDLQTLHRQITRGKFSSSSSSPSALSPLLLLLPLLLLCDPGYLYSGRWPRSAALLIKLVASCAGSFLTLTYVEVCVFCFFFGCLLTFKPVCCACKDLHQAPSTGHRVHYQVLRLERDRVREYF